MYNPYYMPLEYQNSVVNQLNLQRQYHGGGMRIIMAGTIIMAVSGTITVCNITMVDSTTTMADMADIQDLILDH